MALLKLIVFDDNVGSFRNLKHANNNPIRC